VKKWFGYAIHLLVDSQYELPVGFSVTRANASEVGEAYKLLDQLEERHPQVVERCQEVAADRAYDDGKLIRKVWDEWQALPIIDIRNCWQDGELTRVVTGFENVVYDYCGTVSCLCPKSGVGCRFPVSGIPTIRCRFLPRSGFGLPLSVPGESRQYQANRVERPAPDIALAVQG
jgi:hypothetical protein